MPSLRNTKKDVNEETYLKGLLQRDRNVIVSLYSKFYPGIEKMVIQNSGSKKDAEDIFHDGLIVLYKKISTPNFELTSSLYTYFYSICNNLWLKQLRRKSIHHRVTNQATGVLSDDNTPDYTMEKEDRFDLYREKFELLSPSCQQCLALFFQGKSMEEIAKELNYASDKYARKKKFKCKEKLIELIKNDPRYNELSE